LLLPGLILSGGPIRAEPAPTVAIGTVSPPRGFDVMVKSEYKNTFFGTAGSGDINGDGLADIVVVNWRAKRGGVEHLGKVAVVFGTDEGFPAELDLDSIDGSNGFILSGSEADQRLGKEASFIGDINGDGFDDLAVTDDCPDRECYERVYIVFGRAVFSRRYVLDKEKTGPKNYVVLTSGPSLFDASGRAVGDLDGDGYDEVAFPLAPRGNPRAAPNPIPDRCLVLYGRASLAAGRNIRVPKSGKSFAVFDGGSMCHDVSAAGDFDGDGFGDVVVSGGGVAGAIVFGRATPLPPSIDLTDPPAGVRTLRLTSAGSGDGVRSITEGVGPFQAGQAESVFVFPLQEPVPTASSVAGAFVSSKVAGQSSFNLDDVNGTKGVRFVFDDLSAGVRWYRFSLTPAGDFNGDGLSDPLLCRLGVQQDEVRCLLLFGRVGAFPSEVRWSEVKAGEGVFFTSGPVVAEYGAPVATTLGDINGDGLVDLYFMVDRFRGKVVFGTDAYN